MYSGQYRPNNYPPADKGVYVETFLCCDPVAGDLNLRLWDSFVASLYITLLFLQTIVTNFSLHMLWIELDDKFLYISSLSNIFMILSRGKC